MILSRAGLLRPETYLTQFNRDQLVVETNATDVTSNAGVRQLLPEHIDRLLTVSTPDDGRYRAVALRVPTDGVSLIEPFQRSARAATTQRRRAARAQA